MPTSPGRSAGCGTRSAAPTPTSWWPSTTPAAHEVVRGRRPGRVGRPHARQSACATAGCRCPQRATSAPRRPSPPAPSTSSSSTSTACRTAVSCGGTARSWSTRADGAGPRVLCGDVAYEPPPTEPGSTRRRRPAAAAPSGSTSVAAERDSRGRRRVTVLVVVLRRHGPRLHRASGASTRTTSGTAPRTPTSANGSRAAGVGCSSWAERGRCTSTTRAPARPCSTSPTSSPTRTSSPASGGGGRCGRGSTSSTSAAWFVVPPTGAGRSPRPPRARVQRCASGGPEVPRRPTAMPPRRPCRAENRCDRARPEGPRGGYVRRMSTSTEQLGPALDIDARLTEIERSVEPARQRHAAQRGGGVGGLRTQ